MAITVKVKVQVDSANGDPDAIALAMENVAIKHGALVLTKIVTRE
jgi:hypothetical protein